MSYAKRSRVETELDDLRQELERAQSELSFKNDESKSLREALERSNASMRKCEEKVASTDVLKRKLSETTQMMDVLESDRRRASVQRLYVASNQLNKSRLACGNESMACLCILQSSLQWYGKTISTSLKRQIEDGANA